MVLICPHCAARSAVDGAQAAQPMARVACGGCGKHYFVAAAHTDEAAYTHAQTDAARRRTEPFGARRRLRPWLRPSLALVAPLLLLGLLWWDVARLGPMDSGIQVTVQVPGADARGLVLTQVLATPYAPTGGAEGLLIVGTVAHTGPTAVQLVPEVLVHLRHPNRTSDVTARLRACADCTLARAERLQVLAAGEATSPVTLAPQGALPFVGLVPLPTLPAASGAPWAAALSLLGTL